MNSISNGDSRAEDFQIANCLVRRVGVPEAILKWTKLAREYEDGHELSESELGDIMAHYCNLAAAIEMRESNNDPSVFLSAALNLDYELAEWQSRWQEPEPFTKIEIQANDANFFSNHWHFYPNVALALVSSHYRCIRTLVNQIILTQLGRLTLSLDPDLVFRYSAIYNEQVDCSKRLIIELSHDICASVPYFLDQFPQNDAHSCNFDAATRSGRAKLVLWPLYVAGQTECVSDDMRLWIVEQLEKLGIERGTHKGKANGLAKLLRMKMRIEARKWRELGFK
jgi:hypothetical protein